jgi:hypothetical protein
MSSRVSQSPKGQKQVIDTIAYNDYDFEDSFDEEFALAA